MSNCSNHKDVPKTRAEALAAGSKKYVPEKPCVWGHVGEWYADHGRVSASTGRCCECARESAKQNYRANRQARASYQKSYIQKNPDTWYKSHLKRAFGISLDDYYALVRAHAGRCGICGSSDPRSKKNQRSMPGWHVDHDHSTGAIRGILCGPCNHMLGNARDSTAILLFGVDYLNGSLAPCDASASSALSLGS